MEDAGPTEPKRNLRQVLSDWSEVLGVALQYRRDWAKAVATVVGYVACNTAFPLAFQPLVAAVSQAHTGTLASLRAALWLGGAGAAWYGKRALDELGTQVTIQIGRKTEYELRRRLGISLTKNFSSEFQMPGSRVRRLLVSDVAEAGTLVRNELRTAPLWVLQAAAALGVPFAMSGIALQSLLLASVSSGFVAVGLLLGVKKSLKEEPLATRQRDALESVGDAAERFSDNALEDAIRNGQHREAIRDLMNEAHLEGEATTKLHKHRVGTVTRVCLVSISSFMVMMGLNITDLVHLSFAQLAGQAYLAVALEELTLELSRRIANVFHRAPAARFIKGVIRGDKRVLGEDLERGLERSEGRDAEREQNVGLEDVSGFDSLMAELETSAKMPTLDRGSVRFVGLRGSYRYPRLSSNGVHPVLAADLTIDLKEPGEVRVVGDNGVGKSTLLALLTHSRSPGGALENLYDGRKSTDYDHHSVLPLAARITRDGLQHDRHSVYEYVKANTDADKERVVHLLRQLGMLNSSVDPASPPEPAELDFVATRRVTDLSTGQQQIVQLARVLAGDKPLVILDDCEHGLDPENKARMHRAVRDVARSRVVLRVVHGESVPPGIETLHVTSSQDGERVWVDHYPRFAPRDNGLREKFGLERPTYLEPGSKRFGELLESHGVRIVSTNGEPVSLRDGKVVSTASVRGVDHNPSAVPVGLDCAVSALNAAASKSPSRMMGDADPNVLGELAGYLENVGGHLVDAPSPGDTLLVVPDGQIAPALVPVMRPDVMPGRRESELRLP